MLKVEEIGINLEVLKEVIKFLDSYDSLINDLEEFFQKKDDILKYSSPFDKMTPEKFEILERCYMEPLRKFLD